MDKFFKLYKFLFENDFKDLSIEAKVIYSIMLDRNNLSKSNNLIDENGKTYIFMKIEEVQKFFNCSNKTAIKNLKQLEKIGLIKIEKQGGSRSNKIFIKPLDRCKKYTLEDEENTFNRCKKYTLEDEENTFNGCKKYTLEDEENTFNRCKKYTLEDEENTLNSVKKIHPINNNINKTKYNKTDIDKSKALALDKETLFKIPLKDGSYYSLNKQDLDMYKSLYPNIDIFQEIRDIIGWNIANPSKRKTRVGIKKHINMWLSKSNQSNNQNKGGTNFGQYVSTKTKGDTKDNSPTAEDFRRFIQGR